MNYDFISNFTTSLTNYLDLEGIKIKSNAIRILNQNDGDISVYCNQIVADAHPDFTQSIKNEDWKLPIEEIMIHNSKLIINLNRQATFSLALKALFNDTSSLRDSITCKNKTINIVYDSLNSMNDLTCHRVKLIVDTVQNICRSVGYSIRENDTVSGLYFTNKSNLSSSSQSNHKIVLCGAVLNSDHKTKETSITVDQYRDLKKDMLLREMLNRNKIDGEVCASLTDAIIKFDFLRVKISSPVVLDKSNSCSTNSAGSAVFVLYNYSRLNAIIHEFEDRVLKNYYPPLPSVESVDFGLLKENKEWTLMLNFVMNFPTVITNTIQFIEEGKLSPHLLCNFLYSLVRTVSSYYRSTKILLEGKPHLLPIIYARMYLIKAIHQVLRIVLEILCIKVIPAL